MVDNYISKHITSKSDINNYLRANVESYKEEVKNILANSEFTSSQKQDLENMFKQYYYSLNDIISSIELLSK